MMEVINKCLKIISHYTPFDQVVGGGGGQKLKSAQNALYSIILPLTRWVGDVGGGKSICPIYLKL